MPSISHVRATGSCRSHKIVGKLRSLKEMTVEALPSIFHTAMKHHPYLIGLLGVVNPMVRDVPYLTIVKRDFFSWYSFSIAPGNDFCHEQEVVLSVTTSVLESPLQFAEPI